jgi:hypothetical protein
VKAEEGFIAALLAVAANAGMPSFVISKMRLEQERVQRTVEIFEGYLQEFRVSAPLYVSKRSGWPNRTRSPSSTGLSPR